MDFKGGWFKNITVNIPAPLANDTRFVFQSGSNGIELVSEQLKMYLDADFRFKEVITVDGRADIVIKKLSIDFEMDFGVQKGNDTDELAPKISIPKVVINVDPKDIDIKLSGGGLVTKIAAILIPLIKGTIIPEVIKQVETAVQGTVTNTINTDLADFGTHLTIPHAAGVTLDFSQLNGGPQVSADKVLTVALNGTFYDAKNVSASQHHPAIFDPTDLKDKDLQLYLTDYVLNTFLHSAYATGGSLDITYLLQEYLGVAITTDLMTGWIPELYGKYGPGKNVTISFRLPDQHSASRIDSHGQSWDVSAEVTIGVDNETALFVTVDHSLLHGIVNVKQDNYTKDYRLFGNFDTAEWGTLGDDFATTLDTTPEALHKEVQDQLDFRVSQLNDVLSTGVWIPEIAGLNVGDLAINFYDGYLSFGSTVTPDFWRVYAGGLAGIKGSIQQIYLHQAVLD